MDYGVVYKALHLCISPIKHLLSEVLRAGEDFIKMYIRNSEESTVISVEEI